MGLMVDGKWTERGYDTAASGGRFVRAETSFRATLSDTEEGAHPVAAGRYHLYVSLACPWAHRTLIMRRIKGLEALVPVSVVSPRMLSHGWEFAPPFGDALYGAHYLHELYSRAQPDYTGRVTVPVLWDTQTGRIVNNESAEIMRIFDHAFDGLGARPGSYYPEELRSEIDAVNERVYHDVNNGVYKAGFASTQEAYDEAVTLLFSAFDWLEERLTDDHYLVQNRFTEADIRLFTTLIRFDAVYFTHFKCNLRPLSEYPALHAYRRRIYDLPGIAGTVDIAQIKTHYYVSHRNLNPSGIVPKGPLAWL